MRKFVSLSFKMNLSLIAVMVIVAGAFTYVMINLQNERFHEGLKQSRILLETLKDSESQGPKLLTEISVVQAGKISSKTLIDSALSIKSKVPQLMDVKIISPGDKRLLASWNDSKDWPTQNMLDFAKIEGGENLKNLVESDNMGRFAHYPNKKLMIYYTPLRRLGDQDTQGYLYMEYSLESLYKARAESLLVLVGAIGAMILVVVIALTLLNRFLVVRPVRYISGEMQAVGNGDLQRNIEDHKGDEIGDMTRSFNTMVHGLKGFTQYVSKDVVQQILESGDSRIAGTSRKVAIFFSDIRSFTTITEKNSAKEVVEMLNNYFDLMVPIIIESGGNLDKFIGDAVMAEWGGIKPSDRDPYDSCFAAIAQREALARFNEERRDQGIFEVKIGMGINYGDAIVGTLGSESKMEFTVIGDAVNLASRLEGLTKEYAVDIIISHSVAECVQDEYLCCELDKVAVKGKAEGIRIYELVGRKSDDISSQRLDEIKLYEEALSLYQKQEFKPCIKAVQSIKSDNVSAKRLLSQAKRLMTEPPPAGWDGTSIKTTK